MARFSTRVTITSSLLYLRVKTAPWSSFPRTKKHIRFFVSGYAFFRNSPNCIVFAILTRYRIAAPF